MSGKARATSPTPETETPAKAHSTGILPDREIAALIADGAIAAEGGVDAAQIQPASLDLRLGPVAYRVRSSFLTGPGRTVRDAVARLGMHEIPLTGGAVLERGCVYIVPLKERLDLSRDLSALANPKSSTGRLDIFTRVITDQGAEFDRVRAGYAGPLYAEISPRAFSVVVREGSRLSQLRLKRGTPAPSEKALRALHREIGLVDRDLEADERLTRGVYLTVDLLGAGGGGPIGYKARRHTGLVDVDKTGHYAIADFWEPIAAGEDGLILNPDDFYILASKEAVTVPADWAAEMVAYDTLVGEFRVHYAGFFDPGFGLDAAGSAGARAVLEVRSHDVPFLVEHGQTVGSLSYERLTGPPDSLYGAGIGSSYQDQGLALSKHFKPPR